MKIYSFVVYPDEARDGAMFNIKDLLYEASFTNIDNLKRYVKAFISTLSNKYDETIFDIKEYSPKKIYINGALYWIIFESTEVEDADTDLKSVYITSCDEGPHSSIDYWVFDHKFFGCIGATYEKVVDELNKYVELSRDSSYKIYRHDLDDSRIDQICEHPELTNRKLYKERTYFVDMVVVPAVSRGE